jgi:hypothetical protein
MPAPTRRTARPCVNTTVAVAPMASGSRRWRLGWLGRGISRAVAKAPRRTPGQCGATGRERSTRRSTRDHHSASELVCVSLVDVCEICGRGGGGGAPVVDGLPSSATFCKGYSERFQGRLYASAGMR